MPSQHLPDQPFVVRDPAHSEIVPGSGVPIEPANLSTVISLRLRSDFAAALRDVANRRGVTLSDLLRVAAGAVLCQEELCTCPSCPTRESGANRG